MAVALSHMPKDRASCQSGSCVDVYRTLRIGPGQAPGFVHIWVVVPLLGMIFVQLVYSGVDICAWWGVLGQSNQRGEDGLTVLSKLIIFYLGPVIWRFREIFWWKEPPSLIIGAQKG